MGTGIIFISWLVGGFVGGAFVSGVATATHGTHNNNITPIWRERKKRLCVFATSTKRILGHIAKFMYLRLCDFTCCVFVFLGTLHC
jgi:hypothetical protein